MKGSMPAMVAVVLAVGCEAPSSPLAVRIQTESPSYQLGAPITFTVTNLGGSSVFLARCCEVSTAVDRWQDGRWLGFSSGGCLAICPMDAIELGPWGSYGGTTGISDTGRYRLHLGVATSRSREPNWSPTSNPFEVR